LRYKISPDVVVPHVLNINVQLTCFQLLWLIESFLLACFSKIKVDGKKEPIAQVLKQLFFYCVHCFISLIGRLVKIYRNQRHFLKFKNNLRRCTVHDVHLADFLALLDNDKMVGHLDVQNSQQAVCWL